MDPRYARALPKPDERDEWRRYFLPGLTKANERARRRELVELSGLTDLEVDVLLAEYAIAEMRDHPLWEERKQRGVNWSRWSSWVLRIEVEVKRGGRVVMREPTSPFRVEMFFLENEDGTLSATRVEVNATRGSVFGSAPDLSRYWAALLLQRAEATRGLRDGSIPRTRPAPGKPFDNDFYMALLDAESALKLQGHRAPATELARRYEIKAATMRSWLKRAHDRLGE